MDRREFVRKGLLGSATVLVGAELAAREAVPARFDVPASEFDETTIAELQKGMESGRFTAESVTRHYLARIEQLDRQGPNLCSVLETNPDALDIARTLDRERREKGPRGPLHGVPILLKDNLDTADKMTNTAGSLALEGSRPAQDSTVAKKLREAGAVILGKANLSEWANIRSSNSSSGWSARGGQCKNPYALDRNPCGSSSGSGAAISANFAAIAIGTETDGSIVCPANASGLVGIKPTVGLVSQKGIIPISHTQDTAGPMTRTVADAAAVLAAISEATPLALVRATHVPENFRDDFAKSLDPDGLRNARIGVARKFFGFHPEVDKVMDESLAALKKQGAVLIDPVQVPDDSGIGRNELTVLLYELKADLNAYLATLGPNAPVKSLADVIAFNDKNPEREMPYFGQDLFIKAQAMGPLTSKDYLKALKSNLKKLREKGIDATIREHKLDAIVAPTGGPAWVTDHVNGDHFGGGCSTPPAIAGYPHITVPAGFVRGLPVGLSFFGRAWSEAVLIKLAYSFEQATRARKAPQFFATLPG